MEVRKGVEAAACVASDSLVQHGASGRSATFGELAADSAKVALAAEPAITTPDQFKLIGQEVERIDTTLKCTGAARFGIDTLPRRSRPGRRGGGELGLASSPDESP